MARGTCSLPPGEMESGWMVPLTPVSSDGAAAHCPVGLTAPPVLDPASREWGRRMPFLQALSCSVSFWFM